MKIRAILTSCRRLWEKISIGRLLRNSADLEAVLETISAASKDGTLVELALSNVVSEAVRKWPLLQHPDEWRKFFNDMPDAIRPDSFDLHVLMRHIGSARTKARTREQKLRVIRMCEAAHIEYDDIAIGIELAQEIDAGDWFRRLHEHAGDRATARGQHRVAEPHYEKAHAVEKRSRSFELQGRYWDALEYATYTDSSRVLDLINRCIKSVDVEVGWNNYGLELKKLDVLREKALSAPDQTPFAIVIQHLEDKRKELIEAVNTSFINRMNESNSESDKAATRSQWSLFHEAVGNLVDAAEKSTECGQLKRAAELYRRARYFGSAMDLVSTLRAKAILQEQAGDFLGAAETYERDGALKEAIDLYRRAKRFDKFLDLSLSIGHGKEVVENHLNSIVASEVETEAKTKFGQIPPEWLNAQLDEVSDKLAREYAVVTIPAYYQDAPKAATRKACDIAEVKLRRLLHEPTAACIGLSKSKLIEKGDAKSCICVVDIGAGTTDLSVVEVGREDSGHLFEVLDTSGEPRLGGNDFDEAVYKYLVDHVERNQGHVMKSGSENARRLRVAAERLKIDLSHSNSATYILHGIDGQDIALTMSREDLSDVLADQLGRLRAVCEQVRHRLRQTADTYRLLLVGGSTLMPCVQEVVKRVFNVEHIKGVDPRFAVARGAARQGAILAGDVYDETVLDITPFSLGVKAGKDGAPVFFDTLIEERTSIPTVARKTYTTAEDGQDAVDIEVYQTALAPDSYIGHLRLANIPPQRKGMPQIEVTFDIDANCVLTVSAKDLLTKNEIEAKFMDTTLLSPVQIEKARSRRDDSMKRNGQLAQLERLLDNIKYELGEGGRLALKEKAERLKQLCDDFHAPQPGTLDAETEEKLQFIFKRQFALYNNCLERVNSWADLQSNADALLSVESGSIDAVGLEGRVQSAADLLRRLEKEREVMRRLVGDLDAHIGTLQGALEKSGDPAILIETYYDRGDHTEVIGAFEKTLEEFAEKLDDGHVQRYLDSVAEVKDPKYYNDAFRELLGVGKVSAEPIEDWNALDEWIEGVKHSCAFIQARTTEGDAYGSGFLVGANLVATNKHVTVHHGEPLTTSSLAVFVGGGWRKVRLVRRAESDDDLAVLVLTKDIRCARPLPLGRSKVVRTASKVVVAGFPNPSVRGSVDDFEAEDHFKVLGPGIVQGRRRDLPVGEEVFQIGIQLYGGISGAPLFNGNGEVIGLTTLGRSIGEGGVGGVEYFAVFADRLRPLMTSA